MSIEVFDHGSNKAAGYVSIGGDAANSNVRATGVVGAVRVATGVMDIALVEPIAEDELIVLLGAEDTVGQQVVAEWQSAASVRFRTFTDAGVAANRSFWFAIFRAGGESFGAVPVEAP